MPISSCAVPDRASAQPARPRRPHGHPRDQAGTPFFPTDIEDRRIEPRAFAFARPWGIPVRYHDYRAMLDLTNLPFLEYHLSYKDMDEDLRTWFDRPAADFLCRPCPRTFRRGPRARSGFSRRSLSRPFDCPAPARDRCHPRAQAMASGPERPVIVTNMGGFNAKGFLPREERAALYDRIVDSLSRLDSAGVEIIPRRCRPSRGIWRAEPPQPVHGPRRNRRLLHGQRHARVPRSFALATGLQLFRLVDDRVLRKVGPYTAHMHVVDAKGVDGEGLQIGEGHMDFAALARILDKTCPEPRSSPKSGRATRTGARASGRRSTRSNRGSAPTPSSRPDPDDRWRLIVPGLAYGLALGRGGSQGLPGKNVRPLGGHPLIAWSVPPGPWRSAWIGCSARPTTKPLPPQQRQRGRCPFLPPGGTGTSTATDLDVFTHAVEWLAEHEGACPNSLCNCAPPRRFVQRLDR
jgi:hypothetical protein